MRPDKAKILKFEELSSETNFQSWFLKCVRIVLNLEQFGFSWTDEAGILDCLYWGHLRYDELRVEGGFENRY